MPPLEDDADAARRNRVELRTRGARTADYRRAGWLVEDHKLRRDYALGGSKAFHAFRRFRTAHLRKNRMPWDKLWLGHANRDVSGRYAEQMKEEVVQTFWRRLFWPTLLSFLRWPLQWEDSF